MPNVNLVHDSDLSIYKNMCCCSEIDKNKDKDGCSCNCMPDCGEFYWSTFKPPYPPMPPNYPPPPPSIMPPYPFPPPPHHCDCEEKPSVPSSSNEAKICQLSKQAATINRMIDGVKNKKRDVIIKVNDTSYNFGNIDLKVEGWKSTVEKDNGDSYADTVLVILETELGLIKKKIGELANSLDAEVASMMSFGVAKTVADDD